MSKNRIYISGGITGVPDFMERFEKAQKELEGKGYEVYNPALVCSFMPKGTTYEEYMKVGFMLLEMAGSIYMLDDWEKSCGANRELGYAMAKGMEIIYGKGDGEDG